MADLEIKVFDNVFTADLAKKTWELLQRPKWSYTGGSATGGRFWHMEKLDQESFFQDTLFKIICEKFLKSDPSNYQLITCYANGQTANQNGTAHSDVTEPDANAFTFLYYPNPEWDLRWNGALFFLNHMGQQPSLDTEIIKTVSYKPNRAVFFPGNICHYAEAPSQRFMGLRISLAWKILKKN